jgi:TnpA family transposase
MLVRSFSVTTDESVSLLLNLPYFGQLKGVTWYDLLSDQLTRLNAIATPGTLRDSLVLLAVVLEQQTELKPTQIMTDTGA